MPSLSQTFEFYNPWSTKNSHTTQCSITMPQMVEGLRPNPALTLYSDRLKAAGYYGLGSKSHTVSYTVEGAFIGTCTIQVSTTPSPTESDWIDLPDTKKSYRGNETTGGAGISGGFSGAVSRPTLTENCVFEGNYSWLRVRLNISRGTLQAVKVNF